MITPLPGATELKAGSATWDFNTLNPNDIESLSILKDAASLAVYGSRAANGIVMVKTKQGGKGNFLT